MQKCRHAPWSINRISPGSLAKLSLLLSFQNALLQILIPVYVISYLPDITVFLIFPNGALQYLIKKDI